MVHHAAPLSDSPLALAFGLPFEDLYDSAGLARLDARFREWLAGEHTYLGEISAMKLPLKIVMCTSLGYEPIVEEAIRSGASGYIIKPLSETKVLNTLGSII